MSAQGNGQAAPLSASRPGLLSSGVGAAFADGGPGPATSGGEEAAGAAPGSTASGQEDDKGKGKARRIPKFERLRVTGVDATCAACMVNPMDLHHHSCITVFATHAPTLAQVLGLEQYLPQYPQQTRPGVCALNIVSLGLMLWQ